MKTKSIILLGLAYAFSLVIQAQTTKQSRSVTDFSKISSSSGIDVYFTQGNKCSVELETDAENMDKIEVKVENGTLKMKCKDGERLKRNSKIKAYVSAKEIDAVAISGGSDFYATSIKNNSDLNVSASGGSDFNADQLQTKDCRLAFSGGADCNIKNLNAQTVKLAFSGGSDANVHVTAANNIDASASGGSDIKLSGKTKNININCSGGSDGYVKNLSYETISANKSGGSDIHK